MKKLMLLVWVAAVAVGVFLIFGNLAFSDDIYNFYWQKGSGPQTVIQGGQAPPNATTIRESSNDQDSQVATTSSPSTVATNGPADTSKTTAPPPTPTEEPPPKFGILAGYTTFTDDAGPGSGLALGFRWMPISFFGLETQILYVPPPPNDNYYDADTGVSPLRYQLGVILTPLRMKIFGADMLSISGLAGATTYVAFNESTFQDQTEVGGYVGAEVGLDISRMLAITGQAKTIVLNQKAQQQPTQYVAGLMFRF